MLLQPFGQARPRARHSLVEALTAERLEQVVEGVNLERLQRVLVIRGHEDRQRHGIAELGNDFEPVQIGHLQVEQNEVGNVAPYCVDRFAAGAATCHNVDVRLVAQHLDKAIARHDLVLDYDGSNPCHAPGNSCWCARLSGVPDKRSSDPPR